MFDWFDVLLVVIVGAIMLGTIRLAWEQGLDEGWRQAGAELDRLAGVVVGTGGVFPDGTTNHPPIDFHAPNEPVPVADRVPADPPAQPPYEQL